MAIVLGLNAKIYYKASGGSSFAELSNVQNVTLTLESAEADVTTRANSGWRATVPTLKDASVEFEMVYDTEDAGFNALQAAWFNGTTVDLKVLDGGSESTGRGLVATCSILTFSRSESLEEALTVSVTAKPSYSAANPPVWQGGAGAAAASSSGV